SDSAAHPTQPDEAGLDMREALALAVKPVEIDPAARRELPYEGQWSRVGLGPVRPELAEEDVRGDRADPIEGKQARLEIPRVRGFRMKPLEAPAIRGEECLAVAQDLRRLPPIVTDVAALAHDRVHQEAPAGSHDLLGREQTMPLEGTERFLG